MPLKIDDKIYEHLYMEDIYLVFDNGKFLEADAKFYDANYKRGEKLSEEELKYYESEEVANLRDKTIAEINQKREEAKKKYYEEKIKTTKRRVVGWVSDYLCYQMYKRDDEDRDGEKLAALIKYLREEDIFICGDQYQNLEAYPLFDDYTFVEFSRRGWGAIMAMKEGHYGRMDYAVYTESSVYKDDTDWHLPSAHIHEEGPDLIVINDYDYHRALETIDYKPTEEEEEIADFEGIAYLVPLRNVKGYYSEDNQFINLENDITHEINSFMIKRVLFIENEEQFEKEKDDILDYIVSSSFSSIKIVGNENRIREMLKVGPLLLLAVKYNA